MIDQRHYVLTLMAVFLSLSIGIFIGNALLGNDPVITQQQGVIERLQENYYQLQGEHRCLREELFALQVWEETRRDLEKVFLSLLIKRDEPPVRVAIVNTSGEDVDSGLLEYLKGGGVDVCSLGTVSASFNPHNENLMETLRGEFTNLGRDPKGEWAELVKYLATAVIGTGGEDFLGYLITKGLVTITGEPLPGVEVVLLLGNSVQDRRQRIEELDHLLLTAWEEVGLRVIAAEKMDSGALPELYRKKGVSTVTHLNTMAGRLSLLYLLNNDRLEHFGYGDKEIPLLPLEWLLGQVQKG